MFFLKHGSYILTVRLKRPRTKLNVSKSFEIIFKTKNRIQKVIKMNSKPKTEKMKSKNQRQRKRNNQKT